MKGKVSIITATFNSERFIKDLIECISTQTYHNWEWIITDDCSTDNTYQVLENAAQLEKRIKIFRNSENSGAAVSRNNCILNATGDYIAFIDSDDLWDKHKLDSQLKFMIENGYEFTFTAYSLIDEAGHEKNITIDLNKKQKAYSYEDMLKKKATLGCSTVIVKNKIIKDFTMPLLRTGQDYAFWLKILKQNKSAYLLPKALTKYRIVSGSISRNKYKKALRQWEIYRKVENLNFIKSTVCFINYAYRAVFRG